LIVAAQQQITHEWWNYERQSFDLCVSPVVLQEVSQGDPVAAQERLQLVQGIAILSMTDRAIALADDLIVQGALPPKATNDALHVAIAADQAIPYLITWNCRHLANATMQPVIKWVCGKWSVSAPSICTPDQLRRVKP
jgi:hypothetical protein